MNILTAYVKAVRLQHRKESPQYNGCRLQWLQFKDIGFSKTFSRPNWNDLETTQGQQSLRYFIVSLPITLL